MKLLKTWKKVEDIGRKYNLLDDSGLYDYYEVYLSNGKRLDSYDSEIGEIFSRKATDLDKISEEYDVVLRFTE